MADRQRTVMLYCNSLHKGGAERVFAQLAERFADCGYRSILVTSFADPGREEYPLPPTVRRYNMEPERVIQSRLKRNVSRIAALRKILKAEKPDILISCMQEPNFRAMIATRGLPVKRLVSVCNAAEKEYPGKLGAFVGKVLMPQAEGCVFQTEEEKRWFPEKLQKKSRIIMNQVSDSFFDVRHTGARHDLVSVGRLTAQKNQALMIHAFGKIADETEDNLLIYGAGELREELEALITSLGLTGRVRLMGLSSDVASAIKDARCFILSSDFEGVPNALLEAMAMGLPCIATDCLGGGPAMVIKNGVSGLLTPVGNMEALAFAMRRVLQNPAEAESMGRAAREAAERFRPDAVFEDWRSYVEDILNG